ncbi:hypothetical protein [Nocardia vermiculata]|uniref:Uncharacterized protein n=1 Tax=Nocardia vermiculata TaxID=257274 RepID=A0A846Y1Z9_9NOCA|nr:hypothetical protein [Nocardia vermiculata]NKY52867.1 hypothetical protein [Nocardia vermiculata]
MKSAAAFGVAAAAGAATVLATAVPAAAEDTGGAFTTVYSLANGPCAAVVDSSVNGDAYPGMAAFTVEVRLAGVGNCSLDVTLNWRNTETGETGSVTETANGPGYWSNSGRSALFDPGYGEFTGTVTVGAAHIPEPGEVHFSNHPYQG